MRDLSVIDLTTSYLNNLPCGSIKLMSIPYDYEMSHRQMEIEPITESIINTYSCLNDEYPNISLFEFMNFAWSSSIKYKNPDHPEMEYFIDYHPTPVDYANYLIKCNVPISQQAIDYAHDSLTNMQVDNISKLDIVNMFSDCDQRLSEGFRLLW
jgi:hypothetical protein